MEIGSEVNWAGNNPHDNKNDTKKCYEWNFALYQIILGVKCEVKGKSEKEINRWVGLIIGRCSSSNKNRIK